MGQGPDLGLPPRSPGGADAAEAGSLQTAARYQANLRSERESAALYQMLANAEREPHLAEVYRRMAEIEERHATVWSDHLRQAGMSVPAYVPSWRIRSLAWLAAHFGAATVLPVAAAMERDATHTYDGQMEARAAGMPAQERSHARIFQTLQATTQGGVAGSLLA
jgi:hypothetical protein